MSISRQSRLLCVSATLVKIELGDCVNYFYTEYNGRQEDYQDYRLRDRDGP